MMTERIYAVKYCDEHECPNRGSIQRLNKEGETERKPFCYEKCREIPETIGTPNYDDFPDWCPLEVRDGKV